MAHWIMSRGGALRSLIQKYNLSEEFYVNYSDRYKSSITLIDTIKDLKHEGLEDEFYVSTFGLNELFSAIRDEVRAVLLFKSAVPISRWRDSRNNPVISEELYDEIFDTVMISFDVFFADGSILLINEMTPLDDQYFDVFSSLLFLIKEMKTQDATLLTTALLNNADYFVSYDSPLIKSAGKKIEDKYGMNLIKPGTAIPLLRS